jgi:hypothetical protein
MMTPKAKRRVVQVRLEDMAERVDMALLGAVEVMERRPLMVAVADTSFVTAATSLKEIFTGCLS